MSVLRGESLTKSYGRRTVVSDVDLEVRSDEVIALLGRNGAGKTTTFLMMVGRPGYFAAHHAGKGEAGNQLPSSGELNFS
jgi:ABC-type multidrug transport system ATPase subunit